VPHFWPSLPEVGSRLRRDGALVRPAREARVVTSSPDVHGSPKRLVLRTRRTVLARNRCVIPKARAFTDGSRARPERTPSKLRDGAEWGSRVKLNRACILHRPLCHPAHPSQTTPSPQAYKADETRARSLTRLKNAAFRDDAGQESHAESQALLRLHHDQPPALARALHGSNREIAPAYFRAQKQAHTRFHHTLQPDSPRLLRVLRFIPTPQSTARKRSRAGVAAKRSV
jgi:hypothetical protein